ncbi:MAG: 30S ribosomal protein S5 [bacterium]
MRELDLIENEIEQSTQDMPLFEKVISINRITKTTKGGKKLRFSALVVVGDRNGHVGIGMSKAAEVPQAVSKAISYAKKHLESIPLKDETLLFPVYAKSCASCVILKPAPPGTGLVASNVVRAVLEAVGIQNAICKSLKSNNAVNVIKATMTGLKKINEIYKRHSIRRELQAQE